MKKRGQITIFIILGIVVLAAFGFVFYARDIMQGSMGTDIKRGQISETEKTSVSFYIDSLIVKSFKECLHLVGEQGGRIYTDQEGNSVFNKPSYINYELHERIGVGIKSGVVVGNNGIALYRARDGNTIVQEDWYNSGGYIYGLNAPLPPMDSAGGNESIEQQLSDCTRRRFVNSFDIKPFLDMNYKIEVLQPEPNVTVKINIEDISVETFFPVKISTGDTEIIVKDYYYKLNFNFRALYGFVRDIIKRDMYDLDVNIVELTNGDYNISREEAINVDPYTGLKYDVINVTDNYFELDNKHFVFRFIRENRAPDSNTVKFVKRPFYIYEDSDIVLGCPNYLTAHKLVDPDEDDLYAKQQGITDLGWYEFSGYCSPPLYNEECGNIISPALTPIVECQVCCAPGRPMVAFITDYGEALDLKPFSGKIVRCRPPDAEGTGKCCDEDECWRDISDEYCGEKWFCDNPSTCQSFVRTTLAGDDIYRPVDCCRAHRLYQMYCEPKCGECNVKGEILEDENLCEPCP